MSTTSCARRSFFGSVFGQEFNSPHLHHQCTVILIELPCIFFLPEILDIQGFSASAGIAEPVLESFPGRAFSVYSVFYGGSRCNFDCGTTGSNASVVTMKNFFRNSIAVETLQVPVDTLILPLILCDFITAMTSRIDFIWCRVYIIL